MTNNADRKTAGSSESESASMFDFDLSEVFQRAPDNDLHLVTTWSSSTRSNRSISKEASNMSYKTLPLLFINLGGEMIYILDQRLRAQNIPNEKSRKGEWFPLPVLRNFNLSCFYLKFLPFQSLFVFFAFFFTHEYFTSMQAFEFRMICDKFIYLLRRPTFYSYEINTIHPSMTMSSNVC